MGNTPLQFNTNTANITPDVLTPIEPNEMGVIVSDHVIKIGVGKDWTLVITKPASGAVVTLNVKTEEKIEGKVAPAVKQGTNEASRLEVTAADQSRELQQCSGSASSSCLSIDRVKSLTGNPAGTSNADSANENYRGKVIIGEDGGVEINLGIAYSGNTKRARESAKNIRKAYGKAGVTVNFNVISDASKADLIIRGASLQDYVSAGLVCDCSTALLIGGWAPSDNNKYFPRNLLSTTVNSGNHLISDAHEFGHKLGLEHRNSGIMSYAPNEGPDRRQVTSGDVDRIRGLYGQ